MNTLRPISDWLPMSTKEASKRGWDEFDVILISGDAYVDHPAFGTSVIGRIIEDEGLKVGIVAQPIGKTIYEILKLVSQKCFSVQRDAWTQWLITTQQIKDTINGCLHPWGSSRFRT